jgi:4-amino-4-deoxy-L-arabinose transferase-like glycosyltransferase
LKAVLLGGLVKTCRAVYGNRMALPILLTAVACGLRLYRIDEQSLWFDEAWMANAVNQDALSVLRAAALDLHPPLYDLSLHFWTGIVGRSEFALRFFSLAASVALVPFTYLVGRRVQGRRAGLLGATIVTVAPLQVYYAQEARTYSLLPLLSLSSTYFLLLTCTLLGSPERCSAVNRWLVGYIAVTVVGLYTHLTVSFMLAAQLVFVVYWWWHHRRRLWTLLGSQLVIVACCVPWALCVWVYRGPKGFPSLVDPEALTVGWLWVWRGLTAMSFGLTSVPPSAPDGPIILQLIQIAMLAILISGALRLSRSTSAAGRHAGVLLVCTLAIPLALATCLFAPGHPRYLMVATPGYFLLLGFGIDRIGQRLFSRQWAVPYRTGASMALLGVVIAASAFFLNNQYHLAEYRKADDFRTILSNVEWLARPNDAIIMTYEPLQLVLRYYWHGEIPDTYSVPSKDDWTAGQFRLDHAEERLRTVLRSHSSYWLIQDLALSLDGGAVERWLTQNGFKVAQESLGRTKISLFSSPRHRLKPRDLEVNLDGVLVFRDPELGSTAAECGAPLHYVFHWTFLREVHTNYSVSVWLSQDSRSTYASRGILLDEDAFPAAHWFEGDEIEQRLGLLIPPGTPPGRYQVKLTVYDTSTGLPLTILDEDSTPVGTEILLDEVDIATASFYPIAELAPVEHVLQQDVTRELRLLGYGVAADRVILGDTVHLDVYWQALENPTQDSLVSVAVKDSGGRIVHETASAPVNGQYPFTCWTKGEIVMDKLSILVPAELRPGRYQLSLALVDPDSLQKMVEMRTGSIVVNDRPRQFAMPPIDHQVQATFGGKITLLGYELRPVVATPDDSLRLTLYWQAAASMDTSYTVFAHLIDTEQEIWGQMDSIPGRGTAPTSGWVEGEVVVDGYEIPVAPGTPEGEYRIEVGLYNATDGQRLVHAEGEAEAPGDRVLLETVVRIVSP